MAFSFSLSEPACQKIIDSIFPLLFEQFKEMDVLEVFFLLLLVPYI